MNTATRSPATASNGGLGPLVQTDAGELNIGYADVGPADGPVVLLLHGWPYDIHSFAEVAPMLADAGYRVVVPYLREANERPLPPPAELAWWYQFYFSTERGRAGYEQYRNEFARLIWQTASPRWAFDDATFDRTAASFDHPDHVDIVIHNYRWRLGLAEGASEYDDMERRLAERPPIAVPTITLEGDANGAPHPDASSYRSLFIGDYEHRVVGGGVGHNLPQEAPRAFADAVIDVDRSASPSHSHLGGTHVR
jgi:pimeloyl-ACP methyl ester carboxylesterase